MTPGHQSATWPAARLREARAIIADVARHSDHLIRLACNVLATHGTTDVERKDARVLLVVILFRMVATAPAKHCGILVPGPADQLALIHARETTGVTREPFTLPWRRRAVAAFLFPG